MNQRNVIIGVGATVLVLMGLAVYIGSPSDRYATETEAIPSESEVINVADGPRETKTGTDNAIRRRDADPASDKDWILPEVDRERVVELLQNPASEFDLCDSVEWAPFKGWLAAPDAGGPWSLARRDCAREKLGHNFGDPCDFKVNLVIRRSSTGAGEVVAAAAGFDLSSMADEPGVQGIVDTSLASARCKAFARCMATRGYASVAPPLPPGPEGEMFAIEIPGRQLPRSADDAKTREGLEAAIRFTKGAIADLEAEAPPHELAWHLNLAMYRSSLEYYEWLLMQV